MVRFLDTGLTDIGRDEVINILVACNNRNKEWCPFGEVGCDCDAHIPHELEDGEDIHFTCTDKNDQEQNCVFEEVKEDTEIKTMYINVQDTARRILPQYLVKDLKKNERICPVCQGLGIRIVDNIYGIEGDTSETARHKMFPYKKQSLSFCQSCFNGVQKLCPYCGKPYERGYHHCDCEGQKKTDEEKRIKEWEETFTKAKEVQESDVTTYLYCEEFDSYYSEVDDFFEEYEREYSDEEVYTKPERLWVCDVAEISIDAADVAESACSDLHEDAYENCDKDSLQQLLDGWCNEQSGTTTYYPCYKEYVIIDWSRYEETKIC